MARGVSAVGLGELTKGGPGWGHGPRKPTLGLSLSLSLLISFQRAIENRFQIIITHALTRLHERRKTYQLCFRVEQTLDGAMANEISSKNLTLYLENMRREVDKFFLEKALESM